MCKRGKPSDTQDCQRAALRAFGPRLAQRGTVAKFHTARLVSGVIVPVMITSMNISACASNLAIRLGHFGWWNRRRSTERGRQLVFRRVLHQCPGRVSDSDFRPFSRLSRQSVIRTKYGRNHAQKLVTLRFAFLRFLLEQSYCTGLATQLLCRAILPRLPCPAPSEPHAVPPAARRLWCDLEVFSRSPRRVWWIATSPTFPVG